MKRVSFSAAALLAVVFAVGSAFASAKVLAPELFINVDGLPTTTIPPGHESEAGPFTPPTPDEYEQFAEENCNGVDAECAVIYDLATNSLIQAFPGEYIGGL